MRKLLTVVGVAALFLLPTIARAEAPFVEHVTGRPDNFDKGDRACYGVWHVPGEGWHLDITTSGHRHHFKGRIWVEGGGRFVHVKEWKGEGERRSEREEWNWFHNKVKVHENGRELAFDMTSENANVSGLFFEVEGDGPVKWDLWIGGDDEEDRNKREPRHVKVGREGEHPAEIPFQTWAHPDRRVPPIVMHVDGPQLVTHVDGRPENFEKGERAAYGIWHVSDEGWHLDITTAGHRHHFKGKIRIEGEGKFKHVNAWKRSGDEDGGKNWFHDKVKIVDDGREIVFDLVSEDRGIVGVHFDVEGDSKLKWDIGIGGADDEEVAKREPEHVQIGRESRHPGTVPFMTWAHPDREGRGH